ncbi:protein TBATA-like [Coregonus clupeaformis]|uniref:protein TBATA-like n=1 Tax=Coregonus clupeaformis TaxID=59861 RepID=UPI001E1C8F50|nr:protein TBATA-like [Coregonus clupeaformis]
MADRNTGHRDDNVMPSTADVSNVATRGSPRFGALSHHSFFSRHNPHPHRVTHIQGLNGIPVCMVNDDWYVTTSLFPHPLTKSQVFRTSTGAPFSLPAGHSVYGGRYRTGHRTALLSEAWKEELKDLSAKISISTQDRKDKKNENREEGLVRRKTQYSAQTGRIIPPSSQTHRHPPAPALHDQELMVLELLCQILQTDSLSLVQQWLLLAGQREKDLVMGLIQQAMKDSDFPRQQRLAEGEEPRHHPRTSLSGWVLTSCGHRKLRLHTSSSRMQLPTSKEDKPERIGEAEVLEVHPESPKPPETKKHLPQDDQNEQCDQND